MVHITQYLFVTMRLKDFKLLLGALQKLLGFVLENVCNLSSLLQGVQILQIMQNPFKSLSLLYGLALDTDRNVF